MKCATEPESGGEIRRRGASRRDQLQLGFVGGAVLIVLDVVEGDISDVAGDGGRGEGWLVERPDVLEEHAVKRRASW